MNVETLEKIGRGLCWTGIGALAVTGGVWILIPMAAAIVKDSTVALWSKLGQKIQKIR